MVTPRQSSAVIFIEAGGSAQVPAVARLVVFGNQRPVWNRWAEPQNPAGPTPPDGVLLRRCLTKDRHSHQPRLAPLLWGIRAMPSWRPSSELSRVRR
jgi:hypothetical protein